MRFAIVALVAATAASNVASAAPVRLVKELGQNDSTLQQHDRTTHEDSSSSRELVKHQLNKRQVRPIKLFGVMMAPGQSFTTSAGTSVHEITDAATSLVRPANAGVHVDDANVRRLPPEHPRSSQYDLGGSSAQTAVHPGVQSRFMFPGQVAIYSEGVRANLLNKAGGLNKPLARSTQLATAEHNEVIQLDEQIAKLKSLPPASDTRLVAPQSTAPSGRFQTTTAAQVVRLSAEKVTKGIDEINGQASNNLKRKFPMIDDSGLSRGSPSKRGPSSHHD